jgi:hypothetical protein
MDEMLMILPQPRWRMPGTNRRTVLKAADRLTDMTSCQRWLQFAIGTIVLILAEAFRPFTAFHLNRDDLAVELASSLGCREQLLGALCPTVLVFPSELIFRDQILRVPAGMLIQSNIAALAPAHNRHVAAQECAANVWKISRSVLGAGRDQDAVFQEYVARYIDALAARLAPEAHRLMSTSTSGFAGIVTS